MSVYKNNLVKKILKAVCLLLVPVMFTVPVNLSAATSQNISLTGSVVQTLSVAASSAAYDFGDPAVATVSDAAVATITVDSNAASGWTLSLSNTNPSFQLVNGAYNVAYTIKYDAVALVYGASVQLDTDDGSGGSTVNLQKSLTVSLTPDATLPAGSYSDSLTVSIVAN